MNAPLKTHSVALKAPFFGAGENAELHRYFEPEFVPRFQKDLRRGTLSADSQTRWQSEDRFSRHDERLVLRLPMHKSFYLVSCEVVCERLGSPALDPQKIASAGFVIRRRDADGERAWLLEDDEVLGWEPAPTGLRDPDLNRRSRCGPATPADQIASYSGEQTHPLHPIKTYDERGKCHTVLYGYLPLGGQYIPRDLGGEAGFDPESLEDFKDIAGEQLPWPYGYRHAGGRHWREDDTRPVTEGRPNRNFFELLRTLVEQYQLGGENGEDNEGLRRWAENIYFYWDAGHTWLSPSTYTEAYRETFDSERRYSLLSWLEAQFAGADNPLVIWLAEQDERLDQHRSGHFSFHRLPPSWGSGSLDYSLYMTESDAQELRHLLGQRALAQVTAMAADMPRPKFDQGPEAVYQVVPFVRLRGAKGQQECVWAGEGARSESFRVAAPFDPHASRPSLIQMPSLGDLKSGLAKGVSLLTPPDTFGLLKALKLKKGVSKDVAPESKPGSAGIQWICVFSLPVVTLVAMILLMIMVTLLNIVFFWLPWVKIWIPFPKGKK